MLVYRRVNDDPHDRAYLLYSTGLDQKDDGGRAPTQYRERYFAITSNSAKGFDCVFNIPRAEPD
jgi:hypothetical protein